MLSREADRPSMLVFVFLLFLGILPAFIYIGIANSRNRTGSVSIYFDKDGTPTGAVPGDSNWLISAYKKYTETKNRDIARGKTTLGKAGKKTKKLFKIILIILGAIIAIPFWYFSAPAFISWYVWKKTSLSKPVKYLISIGVVAAGLGGLFWVRLH